GRRHPNPTGNDSTNDPAVHRETHILHSPQRQTKPTAHHQLNIPANEPLSIRLRFTRPGDPPSPTASSARTYGAASRKKSGEPFADFEKIFTKRRAEADEFYGSLAPASLTEEQREVQRQAFAGLLWNKQFY